MIPHDREQTAIQPRLRVWRHLWPWIPCFVILAWAWRVENPFRDLTSYGDTLSVVWGALWYRKALLTPGISPLYTAQIFHPVGWPTATMGHPPTFFALTMPFTLLTEPVFAVNLITILAVLVGYAGTYRFARQFVSRNLAILAAIAFNFGEFRWFRVFGHINLLSSTALLPWLAWSLVRVQRSEKVDVRVCLLAGALWGAMINLCLYGLFLGGITFVLWQKQLFRPTRWKALGLIALTALLVASPSIILFAMGRQQSALTPIHPSELLHWSASVNSFWAPSVFHPLLPVRELARAIYSGPVNESGTANLGLLSCSFGVLGAVVVLKRRQAQHTGLFALVIVGLVLSMGLLLRWNGRIASLPWLEPANHLLWRIGHTIKPAVFSLPDPIPPFDTGIPLPGLALTAIVPYWEAARTISRYAFVGALGLAVLAAQGLGTLPKPARFLLAAIWLIEIWPRPTDNLPFPTQAHPAYSWLLEQDLAEGEGIVELASPTLLREGEVLLATWFHDVPTVSGVGAFVPGHTQVLYNLLNENPQALGQPNIGAILRQYQIHYTMLYVQSDAEEAMWAMQSGNPAFEPIGCFDPHSGATPWSFRICVAGVNSPSWPGNVIMQEGWSPEEQWGIWATGTKSTARWIAMEKGDQQLILEAFPLCVPDQQQSILIRINGQDLLQHSWTECAPWRHEVTLPSSLVRVGENEIGLHYGYAARPTIDSTGQIIDSRSLSVGFTHLTISPRR